VQYGSYAEEIVVPADFVAKLPAAIAEQNAAAVPLVALTALQCIDEALSVRAGDVVLITAGAGGVGSFAIQFAKLAGAKVIATASESNFAYMKKLGADAVVDYRTADLPSALRAIAPSGITKIVDAVGGESLRLLYGLLAKGGKLVSIVDTPDVAALQKVGATGTFHFVYPSGEQLARIAHWISEGKVSLPEIAVGSIRDAARYQDENRKGHTRGKVVLAIDF
jgi:NADPH2:quinone reductase